MHSFPVRSHAWVPAAHVCMRAGAACGIGFRCFSISSRDITERLRADSCSAYVYVRYTCTLCHAYIWALNCRTTPQLGAQPFEMHMHVSADAMVASCNLVELATRGDVVPGMAARGTDVRPEPRPRHALQKSGREKTNATKELHPNQHQHTHDRTISTLTAPTPQSGRTASSRRACAGPGGANQSYRACATAAARVMVLPLVTY